MAIPFCFEHEQQWQEDCDECQRARPVADMLDQHRAANPGCDTWPLCSHTD